MNSMRDPPKNVQFFKIMNITCSILNELAQEPDGAYLIYSDQPGSGSDQIIQELIVRFRHAPSDHPEGKIGELDHPLFTKNTILITVLNISAKFANSIMHEIERMKQAIQRGEYRPPPHHNMIQQMPGPPPPSHVSCT